MIDVNVDDSPKCFGVHFNVPNNEAENQFKLWGFTGIKNFKKLRVLNGNTARTEVIASAVKQDAKYFFRGSYDWNIGNDAAIYLFNYDSYTGDLIDGDNDTIKFAANWSGHA